MKRLLVIANLFHAAPRIPGLLGPLAEDGWKITVVSPPVGGEAAGKLGFPQNFQDLVEIAEAPYRGDVFWPLRLAFKRLGYRTQESITEQIKERHGVTSRRSLVDLAMKAYQTVLAYPDTERTWRRPALRVGLPLARSGDFDAILSSSPFPTSHIVANRLNRQTGLPWVADFRDAWTQNPVYDFPAPRRWLETRLEKRTIAPASELLTVSAPWAKALGEMHRRSVHVVPNGFTFKLPPGQPVKLSEKFVLTYTGTIYSGRQNPDLPLAALKALMEAGKIDPAKLEVRFFGKVDQWLNSRIAAMGLESIVVQHGTVDRVTAVEMQRTSQLLLYLNWEEHDDDEAQNAVSSLKFFEYLSAGRPIIATGGAERDPGKAILHETGAGVFALTQQQIEEAVLHAYRQFLETGAVVYGGRDEAIDAYSYAGRSKLLAAVLEKSLSDRVAAVG